MMLRPATPLSILFFVAFVLLLLSTLSTPVIKGIPLASFKGVDFGVWGYCGASNCSKIEIGYDTADVFAQKSDFSLAAGTRHSVSYILIVHPIAALLALICFSLAVASHFHSPAHSPRFLLGLFILTIPTLLASLLAFLVDILLFIPHVGWGGWIVLAATIIVIIASLVTCGMRRTLVSRKARRKRIAENAEMSGENYYKREPDIAVMDATLPRAESPPPLSGVSNSPELGKTTAYGTSFDLKPSHSLDDRTPLNPSNNGSIRGGNIGGLGYGEPGRGPSRGPNGSPPRDQYGNILPPPLNHRSSNGSLGSNRSNPQQMYARGGRGGYSPSRGGYPPRGGPMMRGGPTNMRGPPPSGWNGNGRGRGMGPPGPGMPPGGAMMGRGGPPPPGYGQDRYFAGGPGSRDQSPAPYGGPPPHGMSPSRMESGRNEIGQAVELDERSGLPSPTMPQDQYQPPRAQWTQNKPGTPPALGNRNLSPIQASPIDGQVLLPHGHIRRPSAPDAYLEDVDPRFAESEPSLPLPSSSIGAQNAFIPQSLQPNRGPPMNGNQMLSPTYHPGNSQQDLRGINDGSLESLQEGQRSPAISDASHYTSVSQRGVNPNWRPQPGPQRRGPPPQRVDDMVLSNNPEFSIPGMGPPGRGSRGGGQQFRGRGGLGMGPPRGGPVGGLGSPSDGGRYPAP